MTFTDFQNWPELFAGTAINEMTGGALRWRTLQNMKCKGEIPSNCFVRQGSRKLLLRRDNLLKWWASQISEEA